MQLIHLGKIMVISQRKSPPKVVLNLVGVNFKTHNREALELEREARVHTFKLVSSQEWNEFISII